MDVGKTDNQDLCLISMKLFNKLFSFLMQPHFHYFYFLAAMMVPNIALCFTENLSFWGSLSNIVLPAAVYTYLFTLKRKPGTMIWILFPFVFLAAFQLVLLYLFGNSIIAVDMFLNLVTTNANEAMELLDNLVPAVAGVFILYLPALIIGGISIKKKELLSEGLTMKARKVSMMGCIAGCLIVGITYGTNKEYDAKIDLYPVNVCYNCYLAIERTNLTADYYTTSKDFTFQAESVHDKDQPEVYVFVVGETGRANNWGLYGYERNTTPLLQQQAGVTPFINVLTQSNTTHKSVPMLLSLACAENYDQIYQEKGIIQAFKEAGFYTAFYSNQDYNHSFIDIFGQEADTFFFLKGSKLPTNQKTDFHLLTLMDDLFKEGHQKLFIVLHTYGSHFNYEERYAKDFAKFKPDHITDVTPKHRQNLINAYDNTIIQTDLFLNNLIEHLNKRGGTAALLYTSDHGEDIYDDHRNLFLHASPIPSYYQLHVPFIIWTSDSYRKQYPSIQQNIAANRNKSVASNASAIHTLLHMGGITTPYRNDSLSVASSCFTEQTRHYLNDHNLPETYDQIGLKEEDVEQFKKHQITYP